MQRPPNSQQWLLKHTQKLYYICYRAEWGKGLYLWFVVTFLACYLEENQIHTISEFVLLQPLTQDLV
jgi:hypothetical protein